MTWNNPKKNEQDHDPWKKQKNKINNKEKYFYLIITNLKKFFLKLIKKINFNNFIKNKKKSKNSYIKNFSIFLLCSLISWIVSGFYILKEAESGVITRFGKFHHIVTPGLNWRLRFVDHLCAIDVKSAREISTAALMLTSDENMVNVEINLQYMITNPKNYIYSVINSDDILHQMTDSILRSIVGRYTMDYILTKGYDLLKYNIKQEINKVINTYNMGTIVLDVNIQKIAPPIEVQSVFNDTIIANENKKQYIQDAQSYANKITLRAQAKANKIIEEAHKYKIKKILEIKGEISRFEKLLPEYQKSPVLTKKRLYIEKMEKILKNKKKILIDNHVKNVILIPFDNLEYSKIINVNTQKHKNIINNKKINKTSNANISNDKPSSYNKHDNITDLRLANSIRKNVYREQRE
ncbi:MAG: FtsH protease activity modulator HflK [Pantoea sp. Brub]|nr:FtsH protease activity modulator HflK [Pantoea sp. Brub]